MVPYEESLKLRDALTAAQVPNELVTIPGGKHGSIPVDGCRYEFVASARLRLFCADMGYLTRSSSARASSNILGPTVRNSDR